MKVKILQGHLQSEVVSITMQHKSDLLNNMAKDIFYMKENLMENKFKESGASKSNRILESSKCGCIDSIIHIILSDVTLFYLYFIIHFNLTIADICDEEIVISNLNIHDSNYRIKHTIIIIIDYSRHLRIYNNKKRLL